MTEKLLLLYGNQVENGFLEEQLHSPTQRDSNEDLKKESLSTIILVSDEKKDLPESFISQTDKKNKFMKIFSLIIMTILNSTIVLIMRYLRTRKGDMFIATTAVISTEFFKFILSLILVLINEKSIFKWAHYLWENTIQSPKDCAKMSVPGFVYTLQNNLFFIVISNLDVATAQVLYQFRIFTTCIFSVVILGKEISRIQALSMITLFAGISLVQLNLSDEETHNHPNTPQNQNPLLGVIAVLLSTFLSGFAGVYVEKMLKSTQKSLWLRNTQLSFFGIVFGIFGMFTKDYKVIFEKGFFFGYDTLVIFTVFMQAISGMTIAVVFKYADNILKSFAASTAILISCVAAVYFFQAHLTLQFFLGALCVVLSIFLYNS